MVLGILIYLSVFVCVVAITTIVMNASFMKFFMWGGSEQRKK